MKWYLPWLMMLCIWPAAWADDTLTAVAQPLWSVRYFWVDSTSMLDSCVVLSTNHSDTVSGYTFQDCDSCALIANIQDCFYSVNFATSLAVSTGYYWRVWIENLSQQTTPWMHVQEYPQTNSREPFEFPCRNNWFEQYSAPSHGDSGENCAYYFGELTPAYNQYYLNRYHPDATHMVVGLDVPNQNMQRVDSVVLYWLVPTADAGETRAALPTVCTLAQNYPNPFNPVTEIPFTLPRAMNTSLRVYDLLGREVAVLANGVLSPGTHTARFGSPSLPSGVYIYRLEVGGQMETKKMVMMK